MFQRIIKRSQRKLGKSDPNLTSNVVVNHASRITVTNSTVSSTSDTQPVSSSPRTPTTNVVIEMLPPLRDAVVSDRPSLFLHKIVLCSSLCDFSDSLKSVREKEIKRQTLHELIDFLHSNPSFKLNDLTQSSLIQMISLNIFRCLPPSSHEHSTSSSSSDFASPEDEDDPYLEPSWPHLQLVYELLLRYIVSPDTDIKVAKRHVDNVFVLKILELFDSEDPREREYLKTILHRIYGKFMVHRPFIRKAINNVFYTFIFETQRHSGISELLEILGSIINGFALPMKEEHKLFLVRALIPLHKAKGVAAYHQQLAYCVVQFVERDCKLADNVIRGLLKYWPLTNCSKEVLFLGEMEEVLETTQAAEFQSCMVPLFRQLGRCLNSPHFQVAERTLYFWNSDHILSLIAQNRNVIFPIIFEALEKNMQGHWNRGVHGLTANVLKMFQEMDAELYEECQRQYSEKEARASELEEQRQMTWKRLEAAAAQDGGEDMVLVN